MKNHDNIENLIIKNLNALNDNEPSEGHFMRFEQKLKTNGGNKKNHTFTIFWKVAAAAVFAFLLVNQAVIWFSGQPAKNSSTSGNEQITLAALSSEYEEVEFYYTNAINVGLKDWEQMVNSGLISDEEQQMLDQELKEFEMVFEKLQNDLALSPNDERVINAMLDYYQAKLNLINLIVGKLQEVKQKNNLKHESKN